MYASEPWMIMAGAYRNNLIVEKIESLAVDTLMSVDMNGIDLKLSETKLEKKAPRTLANSGRASATTVSRGAITKREVKGYVSDLKKAAVISFFADDVVCAGVTGNDEPDPAQCYDWLVMGSNEEYDNTVFKFTLKNLFPYEAEALLDGRLITRTYKNHVTQDGELHVWVSNAYWRNKNAVCH